LKRFDERIEIGKFLPPLPESMQTYINQTMQMQQQMGDPLNVTDQMSSGMPQAPGMEPPQQLNEAVNAPQNRVMQRTRNEYREPQGAI
jgi:hypothetical protein